MKKLLLTAAALACAMAVTVNAAEKKKPELTEEGKKVMKEMLEKYDVNKDGKLDQEERAKISADDQKKMKDAGIPGGPKKKDK